jgi:hypothetical protein
VSAILSALEVPDRAASPAARFTSLGRAAAAATLVAGAGCQVIAFSLAPNFSKTADRLQWIADNPTRADVSKVFDVLAMPFLLASVIVYFLLARDRSTRLAWAAAIVFGLGLVGLSIAQGIEVLEFALVKDGRVDHQVLAHVVDNASTASLVVTGVMFLGGVLIGILLTMAALWRSRAVPRGAVVLMLVFVILDVPLQRPLTAHIVALVAAGWIAWAILQAREIPA